MIKGKVLNTEADIELIVEHSMDGLDHQLLIGNFTQEQYDMAVKALDLWAKDQLDKLRRTLH